MNEHLLRKQSLALEPMHAGVLLGLVASFATGVTWAAEPEQSAELGRTTEGDSAVVDEDPEREGAHSPQEGESPDFASEEESESAAAEKDPEKVVKSDESQESAGHEKSQANKPRQESQAESQTEDVASTEDDDVPTWQESLLPEVHGFVSQGFIKSTDNNYLAQSERGSFEFNEVGLNFTKQISERLRVGMQLFMRDLGPIGNYKPQFDWFYLDYNFFDWLGIRAGRTKIPFGLYNEVNDIDSARIPVLLPQSVYPTENRDYLLAQTGLELYGRIPLGALGHLGYRAYGGTIFLDASENTAITNFEVPYVVGGRLMWETPLDGLRAGGTLQTLSLDGDAILGPEILQGLKDAGLLPADASNLLPFRIPAVLWVTSLEYAVHDFQFAAEYGRWHARIKSDLPEILPPTVTTNERFYVMASYRVARWFAPGAYYSVLFPNVEDRSGPESQWHDVALTVRFDITDNWLFKMEGHYNQGTAGLNSNLNDGVPLTDLSPTWGLFLAKTTAYF